jgi:hypothetical protein
MRGLSLFLVACTWHQKDPIPPARAASAQIEIIDMPKDPKGDTGLWPNVLVDKHGQVFVAYCDGHMGDVKLARRENGWHVETVDAKGAVGKYLTAVMGPQGIEMIYLDQDRKTLKYAHQVAGAWQFQDIGSDHEDIGISGVFALGPHGERALVHYDTRNQLLLTQAESGAAGALKWTTRKLADAGGVYNIRIGARFDEQGALHISYPDWNMMSGVFHHVVIAPGQAELKPLTLDTDLVPGLESAVLPIAGGDDVIYMTGKLGYLYETEIKNGVASDRQRLTDNIANMAALQTRDGRTVLGLQVAEDEGLGLGALDLAVRKDGKWERVAIDAGRPVGQYIALGEGPALGGVPQIHLVYYDGKQHGLKYVLIH